MTPVMTDETTIDYEALELGAKRGIVRTVLERVAKDGGLPGGHHFYVAFNTQMPGVTMSKRLRERYPNDMTIVLQHRYWDLFVSEDRFEVKLTFESIPERLVIPYAAIRQFYDPSVPYGMQFDDLMVVDEPRGAGRRGGPKRQGREGEQMSNRGAGAADAGDVVVLTPVGSSAPTPIKPGQGQTPDGREDEGTPKRRPQRRARSDHDEADNAPQPRRGNVASIKPDAARLGDEERLKTNLGRALADQDVVDGETGSDDKLRAKDGDIAPNDADREPGANVVSLDKFRKK